MTVEMTGLQSVSAIIDARRTALLGHVASLDDRVLTRCTLRLAIDVRSGTPPSLSWKRPRGHPRDSNHSCTPTIPSRSSGMLLLDLVMVFRRNVPRWARVFDDDDDYADDTVFPPNTQAELAP